MALNIDIAAVANTVGAGSTAGASGLAALEEAGTPVGSTNTSAARDLGSASDSASGDTSLRARWQSALAQSVKAQVEQTTSGAETSANSTVATAMRSQSKTVEAAQASSTAAQATAKSVDLALTNAAGKRALKQSIAQNVNTDQPAEEISSDMSSTGSARGGKRTAGSRAEDAQSPASIRSHKKTIAASTTLAVAVPAAPEIAAQPQTTADTAPTLSAAAALPEFPAQSSATSGQAMQTAATNTASTSLQQITTAAEIGTATTANAVKHPTQSQNRVEAASITADAAQSTGTSDHAMLPVNRDSSDPSMAKGTMFPGEGQSLAQPAGVSVPVAITDDPSVLPGGESAARFAIDSAIAKSSGKAAAAPTNAAARKAMQAPSSNLAAADGTAANRGDISSSIHAAQGASSSQTEAHVSAAQTNVFSDAIATPASSPLATYSATHTAETNSPATTGTSVAHETFAALDAEPASSGPTWVHAGARQAEAGFQDPSLGWVGVRADLRADGVHAAIVPGSADAASTLSDHIAGVSAHLAAQHIPVESLSMASAGSGSNDAFAMHSGAGQGHTAGQNGSSESNAGRGASEQSSAQESSWASQGLINDSEPSLLMNSGAHISVMA